MTTKHSPKALILTDTASKARAIKRLLGRQFNVVSSEGFLRDLPKTQAGIDPKKNFELKPITVRGKAPLLNQLRKETVDALRIYLAPEPGREGEALAAHYCQLFGINPESKCRVELHALTRDAIKLSLENARAIDNNAVEEYWTRRSLNRLIAHGLRSYLWCAIYRGLAINPMQLFLLRFIVRPNSMQTLSPPTLEDAPINLKTLQLWAARDLNFAAGRIVLIARELYEGMNFDKNFSGLINFYKDDPIEPLDVNASPDELKQALSVNRLKVYRTICDRKLPPPTEPLERFEGATDFRMMLELERLKLNWTENYSSAINTLVKNNYIERVERSYAPTELGLEILARLDEHFSTAVDVNGFVELEKQFDAVGRGKLNRIDMLKKFYDPFAQALNEAMRSLGDDPKPKEPPMIESDQICEKCGRRMVIKRGRYGPFLACPGYPECKNTKPYTEYLDEHCPKCGGRLVRKNVSRARNFYGCEHYPECDFGTWDEPQEKKCSVCGSLMLLHRFRDRSPMLYCSNEKCPSRESHPINKILERVAKKVEEK